MLPLVAWHGDVNFGDETLQGLPEAGQSDCGTLHSLRTADVRGLAQEHAELGDAVLGCVGDRSDPAVAMKLATP